MLFVLLVALGCTSSSTPSPPVQKPIVVDPVEEPKPPQEVEWRQPINRTLLEAFQTRKPVVMYMHLEGCPYCALMESQVLSDQQVVGLLNDEFIPVWVNATEHEDNLAALGINTFPSLTILTPDGFHIYTIEGVIPPDKLAFVLRVVSEYVKSMENESASERESFFLECDDGEIEYRI